MPRAAARLHHAPVSCGRARTRCEHLSRWHLRQQVLHADARICHANPCRRAERTDSYRISWTARRAGTREITGAGGTASMAPEPRILMIPKDPSLPGLKILRDHENPFRASPKPAANIASAAPRRTPAAPRRSPGKTTSPRHAEPPRMTSEMSVASAGIASNGPVPRPRVPPRPPPPGRRANRRRSGGQRHSRRRRRTARPSRTAPAGSGAAAGRRPRGRAAAGAGRAGYRQDHHDRGRGSRPDREPRHRARADPGPHVQPQGRRRAARAHHRPATAHHPRAAGGDLPQLRLRAGPARVRAGRRRAAAAALRAGAAAGNPPDAEGRGPGRRFPLAGAAQARAGHPRLRRGSARPAAARSRARPGRPQPAPAGQAQRP